MLRFLVIGVGGKYAGLSGVGMFKCFGGDVVVHLCVSMDIFFCRFVVC